MLNITISVPKELMQDSMEQVTESYNKQLVALGHIKETIFASSKTQVKILNAVQGLHAKFDGTYEVLLRRGRLRKPKAGHEPE